MLHRSSPLTKGLTRRVRQVENDARAGVEHWALVKGAPEVVRGFLRSPPADYDATYRAFAAQGGRCALDKMRYMGPRSAQSACAASYAASLASPRHSSPLPRRAACMPCTVCGSLNNNLIMDSGLSGSRKKVCTKTDNSFLSDMPPLVERKVCTCAA